MTTRERPSIVADDAFILFLPGMRAHVGAPLAAVGSLDCLETPAVQGWLHAHDTTLKSDQVRILPPEASAAIPEEAEYLPVPLSTEETEAVRRACATDVTAGIEAQLLDFRHTAEDRDRLVRQALATGLPPHRIAELTGLDPQVVGELAGH